MRGTKQRSPLETLNEWLQHMHELNTWPAQVVSDSGRRYTFAGLDEQGRGMYGGMSGYAFTLAEARRYSSERAA